MEQEPATQITEQVADAIKNGLIHLAWSAYENAAAHGFHDGEFNFGEKIALKHSELSESLEYYRKSPDEPDDKLPQYPGWLVELADVVIRIGDTVAKMGAHREFAEVLVAKMNFNLSRPYKHGKKF
jgi:hypothetical protein